MRNRIKTSFIVVLVIILTINMGGTSRNTKAEETQKPRYVALLFGCEDYLTKSDVEGSINDIIGMEAILKQCGYEVEFCPNYTISQARELILSYNLNNSDTIFMYFSGHGGSGTNYGWVDFIDYSMLTYDLKLHLDATGAGKKIVFLDSCRSGSFIDWNDLDESYYVLSAAQSNEDTLGWPRFSILNSNFARENLESSIIGAYNLGVFSESIHSACGLYNQTSFDVLNADTNNDNRLTLNELYSYVKTRQSNFYLTFYAISTPIFIFLDAHVQVFPEDSDEVIFDFNNSTDTSIYDLDIFPNSYDSPEASYIYDSQNSLYTVLVPSSTYSIRIEGRTNIYGATLSGDIGYHRVDTDNEYFYITCTSIDGTNSTQYAINIIKASGIATLDNITLNGGGIDGFLPYGYSYIHNVPYNITSINIGATLTDPNSTISGDLGVQSLSVGTNVFTISVTSEDGTVTNDYAITVNRANDASDATLSAIYIDNTPINGFNPSTTFYNVTVNGNTESVILNADITETASYMTGLGRKYLDTGNNYYDITVTSEDRTEQTTYTVNIIRPAISNYTLSAIIVDGTPISNFSPEVYKYTMVVPSSTDSVYVEVEGGTDPSGVLGYRTLPENEWVYNSFHASNVGPYYFLYFYRGSNPSNYPGLVFNSSTRTVTGYTANEASVVIPEQINGTPVEHIGESAFDIYFPKDHGELQSFTLPTSLITIGNESFEDCDNLINMNIPYGVESIGTEAFKDCFSLESISIPSSVTSLGSYAFEYCQSLQEIVLPASLTSIEAYTFKNCSSLTKVTIPETITQIASDAFTNCNSGLTIYGYTNSYAEDFADATGISFSSIGTIVPNPSPTPTPTPPPSGTPYPTPEPTPTPDPGESIGTAITVIEGFYSDSISVEDERIFYKFVAPETDTYVVETSSLIDTAGILYDNNEIYLVTDDDSGEDNNFKFIKSLSAGETMYIEVRGYSQYTLGDFSLDISRYVAPVPTYNDLSGYIKLEGKNSGSYAGVTVSITDGDSTIETQTDSNGYFILQDIISGNYSLSLACDGYLLREYDVLFTDSDLALSDVESSVILLAGDFDGANGVDTGDLALMISKVGATSGDIDYESLLDIDGVTGIDIGDLAKIIKNLGMVTEKYFY